MSSRVELAAVLDSLEQLLSPAETKLVTGAKALLVAREAALERLRSLAIEMNDPESELSKRARNAGEKIYSRTNVYSGCSVILRRAGRSTKLCLVLPANC